MFLENKEEPSEIKKMINMLYDFKNFLHETTQTDVESFFSSEKYKDNDSSSSSPKGYD